MNREEIAIQIMRERGYPQAEIDGMVSTSRQMWGVESATIDVPEADVAKTQAYFRDVFDANELAREIERKRPKTYHDCAMIMFLRTGETIAEARRKTDLAALNWPKSQRVLSDEDAERVIDELMALRVATLRNPMVNALLKAQSESFLGQLRAAN